MREVATRARKDGKGDAGAADGAFVDFVGAVGGEEAAIFSLPKKHQSLGGFEPWAVGYLLREAFSARLGP